MIESPVEVWSKVASRRGHEACFVERWYFSGHLRVDRVSLKGVHWWKSFQKRESLGDQGQPMWPGQVTFVPDVEIGGHSGCRGRWKL